MSTKKSHDLLNYKTKVKEHVELLKEKENINITIPDFSVYDTYIVTRIRPLLPHEKNDFKVVVSQNDTSLSVVTAENGKLLENK